MKTVEVTSIFSDDIERCWRLVLKTATLDFVTEGFIELQWLDALPEEWVEGEAYRTRSKVFGFLPFGGVHTIKVVKVDHENKILSTHESDAVIKTWNHDLIVQDEDGRVKYTDRIEIDAGFLTFAVCIFAKLFYEHRQRRWRLLLRDQISS